MTTASNGYSRASIIIHWVTAILVIALFFTHEGDRGSAAMAFHIGGGAIFGLFLLWRVSRRILRGMTDKPDQSAIFNLASQIVIWGFLVAIIIVVISGYFLPWSRGSAIDIFGLFQIPSPIATNHDFHEIIEKMHNISGQLIVPLFVLHLLGALKHQFIDKDTVMQRMVKPVSSGK
jgi:cytochrome b561